MPIEPDWENDEDLDDTGDFDDDPSMIDENTDFNDPENQPPQGDYNG